MPAKYIATLTLLFAAMMGWQAFLVVRDNKMFDAYYGKQTQHEQYCKQLQVWHPDCKVE